jgi:hypothetical protein
MSAGVVAGPFPSVFKEGWLRLNKKIPFLSGADGVVSKFKQNMERYASI